jgi:hypothetical protein
MTAVSARRYSWGHDEYLTHVRQDAGDPPLSTQVRATYNGEFHRSAEHSLGVRRGIRIARPFPIRSATWSSRQCVKRRGQYRPT